MTLLFTAILLIITFLIGYPFSRFLINDQLRGSREFLFAPIIGLIVLQFVSFATIKFGSSLDKISLLMWIICFLNIILVGVKGFKRIKFDTEFVFIVTLLLCTILMHGFVPALLTPNGGLFALDSNDAATYIANGDFYAKNGQSLISFSEAYLQGHPILSQVTFYLHSALRIGSSYILGLFSSMLGVRSYMLFNALTIIVYSYIPLAIYYLAKDSLKLNIFQALVVGAIAAFYPLLIWNSMAGFLPQGLGMLCILFLLISLRTLIEDNANYKNTVLVSFGVAGVIAAYPEILATFIPFIFLYLLWSYKIVVPKIHYLIAALVIAFILCPWAFLMAAKSLPIQMMSKVGYPLAISHLQMLDFSFGLAPVMKNIFYAYKSISWMLFIILGFAGFLLGAKEILRKSPSRLIISAMIIFVVLSALFIFKKNEWSLFKIQIYYAFVNIVFLGLGVFYSLTNGKYLKIIGLFVMLIIGTNMLLFQYRVASGKMVMTPNVPASAVGNEYRELQSFVNGLGPDIGTLVIDVNSDFKQNMLAYFFMDRDVYYTQMKPYAYLTHDPLKKFAPKVYKYSISDDETKGWNENARKIFLNSKFIVTEQ